MLLPLDRRRQRISKPERSERVQPHAIGNDDEAVFPCHAVEVTEQCEIGLLGGVVAVQDDARGLVDVVDAIVEQHQVEGLQGGHRFLERFSFDMEVVETETLDHPREPFRHRVLAACQLRLEGADLGGTAQGQSDAEHAVSGSDVEGPLALNVDAVEEAIEVEAKPLGRAARSSGVEEALLLDESQKTLKPGGRIGRYRRRIRLYRGNDHDDRPPVMPLERLRIRPGYGSGASINGASTTGKGCSLTLLAPDCYSHKLNGLDRRVAQW